MENKTCPECGKKMIKKYTGQALMSDPTQYPWNWWCGCGNKETGGVEVEDHGPTDMEIWESENKPRPQHIPVIDISMPKHRFFRWREVVAIKALQAILQHGLKTRCGVVIDDPAIIADAIREGKNVECPCGAKGALLVSITLTEDPVETPVDKKRAKKKKPKVIISTIPTYMIPEDPDDG